MNRYNEQRTFNDALGEMIQWSLRGDMAHVAPSPAVWQRVEQRVQALARTPLERPSRRALLRRLVKHAVQLLDDNTLSSEAIWTPDSPSLRLSYILGYRSATAVVGAWPVVGQMLPIF